MGGQREADEGVGGYKPACLRAEGSECNGMVAVLKRRAAESGDEILAGKVSLTIISTN